MAAYIIADIDVTDPEGYRTYAQQTQGTLDKYGGKFLVRGGQHETIEGDWQAKRVVVIEFPSVEQAKVWYNSPEYLAIAGIRHRSTVSRIILVQGV
ncbi:MAG TPA: DUF1330 domain-containing protein [Ktedonobacteraceae bacterium]|nr:DUF1330 domain-containing protein [Ktedonobacteraceae bacterium]